MTGEKGIAELVFTFFRLLGREPVQIRKGIWQVFLDASLAKALDGWRGKERLFQYTFDRRLADTYGAELIAPGSYRLDTILQAVRNQARLSRAHLPHDLFHEPSIRSSLFQRLVGKAGSSIRLYVLNLERSFSPYLWVVSLVSRITHQRSDAIHHSCVDLRTGRVTPLPISNQLFVGGLPPGGRSATGCSATSKHILCSASTLPGSWKTRIRAGPRKLGSFSRKSRPSWPATTKAPGIKSSLRPGKRHWQKTMHPASWSNQSAGRSSMFPVSTTS